MKTTPTGPSSPIATAEPRVADADTASAEAFGALLLASLFLPAGEASQGDEANTLLDADVSAETVAGAQGAARSVSAPRLPGAALPPIDVVGRSSGTSTSDRTPISAPPAAPLNLAASTKDDPSARQTTATAPDPQAAHPAAPAASFEGFTAVAAASPVGPSQAGGVPRVAHQAATGDSAGRDSVPEFAHSAERNPAKGPTVTQSTVVSSDEQVTNQLGIPREPPAVPFGEKASHLQRVADPSFYAVRPQPAVTRSDSRGGSGYLDTAAVPSNTQRQVGATAVEAATSTIGQQEPQHADHDLSHRAGFTTDSSTVSAPAFPGVGVQPFQGSSAGGSAPVSPSQPPAQSVPAPLPPQPQLVAVLAGLRQAADGSYRVALQLQPAELGTVSVQVDVRRGVASVHFRTDKAGTSDALRAGLDQLRGELLASGLSIDDITVAVTSQDGGSLGDHGRHPASSADDEDAEWVPLASANSTNQNRIRPSLDVRL